MRKVPDWTHRGEYIRARSSRKQSGAERDIEPEWANEAYLDPDAARFRPDPASRSGDSDRTIGYSPTAGAVITVITVEDGGHVWGANAWIANDVDVRRYERRAP